LIGGLRGIDDAALAENEKAGPGFPGPAPSSALPKLSRALAPAAAAEAAAAEPGTLRSPGSPFRPGKSASPEEAAEAAAEAAEAEAEAAVLASPKVLARSHASACSLNPRARSIIGNTLLTAHIARNSARRCSLALSRVPTTIGTSGFKSRSRKSSGIASFRRMP